MGMDDAYKTSGKIFQQVSMRYQPALLEQLKGIQPGEIVVVQGTYDHIEKLLDTIKVPYEMITPDDMGTHNGGRVMFVNCRQYDGVNKSSKKGIEDFVQEGGRLVTTDWSVGLVSSVFPGKIKKTVKTSDDVIEIQCNTDIARRFVGMNYAQCSPQWWLEGSSDVYSIGEGVTPLITSDEMKAKYGQPYVAVGFVEGRGEVIHFISHLELQRTRLRNKADESGLDDFVKKMKIDKTEDMDEAKVAELEAAYSTLNTVAYLCLNAPIIGGAMKSITLSGASKVGSKKSVKLM
ncbi:MAG: hypothetical protein V2A62_03835 [Candidatus Woesearchaeota archaeon]